MGLSVGFISLGCAKNTVDAQVMAGFLKKSGAVFAPSPEKADVIIVNTCAFIRDAREESVEAVLQACEHKRRGACKAVIVTGCLSQRYRERLAATFPLVDAFLGVNDLELAPEVLAAVESGKLRSAVKVSAPSPGKVYNPEYPSLLFTGAAFAYLKIAEGCDHGCTFCAIPGIRGRYRSRLAKDIVAEAKALVKAGVKELDVVAQDTTRYGCDLKGGANLAGLLRKLDEIPGDFRIRVLYAYPSAVTDELIETIAQSGKICRYLDIPIQHVSEKILRAMGRADEIAATKTIVSRLREAIPSMVLRTTFMTGFPGETEKECGELLDFIRTSRFDHIGIFPFSPEEGTRALELAKTLPTVSETIARRWRRMLMREHASIIAERAKNELRGTYGRLLLATCNGENGKGWLDRQTPGVDGVTYVTHLSPVVKPGDFVEVRISGAKNYDLLAHASRKNSFTNK
jgi:ribosomal protein S12 methylthiotransferase